MAFVWCNSSSLLTDSPSFLFLNTYTHFILETYPGGQEQIYFSFKYWQNKSWCEPSQFSVCVSSNVYVWPCVPRSSSPKLLGSEERREWERLQGGRSEREMGTPILNPLFNLMQGERDWRGPLTRCLHWKGVNTRVWTNGKESPVVLRVGLQIQGYR